MPSWWARCCQALQALSLRPPPAELPSITRDIPGPPQPHPPTTLGPPVPDLRVHYAAAQRVRRQPLVAHDGDEDVQRVCYRLLRPHRRTLEAGGGKCGAGRGRVAQRLTSSIVGGGQACLWNVGMHCAAARRTPTRPACRGSCRLASRPRRAASQATQPTSRREWKHSATPMSTAVIKETCRPSPPGDGARSSGPSLSPSGARCRCPAAAAR